MDIFGVQTLLKHWFDKWLSSRKPAKKKIHGDNDDDNELLQKEKLTEKATELYAFWDSIWPSNDFFFPKRLNQLIKKLTAKQTGTWITTSCHTIMNSVTKWTKHRKAGLRTVFGWLTLNNPNNRKIFTDLRRSQRKRMEEQIKINGWRRSRRQH